MDIVDTVVGDRVGLLALRQHQDIAQLVEPQTHARPIADGRPLVDIPRPERNRLPPRAVGIVLDIIRRLEAGNLPAG